MATHKVHRSSITGKFVSRKFAASNKATTETETVGTTKRLHIFSLKNKGNGKISKTKTGNKKRAIKSRPKKKGS